MYAHMYIEVSYFGCLEVREPLHRTRQNSTTVAASKLGGPSFRWPPASVRRFVAQPSTQTSTSPKASCIQASGLKDLK